MSIPLPTAAAASSESQITGPGTIPSTGTLRTYSRPGPPREIAGVKRDLDLDADYEPRPAEVADVDSR